MINCIYLEEHEGWCKNEALDMFLDYPSEHYCKGCYHRIERGHNANKNGTEQDQKIEADN